MAKVNYVTVGSNDLEKAKAFYDGLLGSIGFKPLFEHPSGGRLYRGDGCMFGVLGPFDGNPACIGNGMMGGFAFDTVEEVDVFHAKALELGGKDEGSPGARMPKAYFAYFRDLDGNKLCGYKIG
ncbi:VOC family protein [Caulobacter sp. RL271]|uniref:VOC family protein n=1 Tax=Caulobacter segnis TaxID=88688 RepID=A0ABY4ZSI2_9CAUL|nr:VOC family protein [Caulobacter segnis]USQ95767.1 VOC family protein [Caulobacter segnis]